jgi:hypothetical protein
MSRQQQNINQTNFNFFLRASIENSNKDFCKNCIEIEGGAEGDFLSVEDYIIYIITSFKVEKTLLTKTC